MKKELAKYAGAFIRRGTNWPEFVVLTSKELPFVAEALDDSKCVLYGYDLFLVRQSILSAEDANGVIFHKMVGHCGLCCFFGYTLNAVLDTIHKHNPLLRSMP